MRYCRQPRQPRPPLRSCHADARHLHFELNADGSDYVLLPEGDDQDFLENWEVLRMVLEEAPQKLTRLDILDEWPEDFAKPNAGTLWRWLERAVDNKTVQVEGKGSKTDPFRYWTAAAEARWRESPFYEIGEQQLRDLKMLHGRMCETLATRRIEIDGTPAAASRIPAYGRRAQRKTEKNVPSLAPAESPKPSPTPKALNSKSAMHPGNEITVLVNPEGLFHFCPAFD